MRLLLDTHVLLWWLADDPLLGDEARRAIRDPSSSVWVSAASLWEISIKSALGHLSVGCDDLASELEAAGLVALPISWHHALAAGALPKLHRDPFDRMLVAQAQLEGLHLVTRDPLVAAYDVAILAA